jgi:hypothetical protein
MQVQTVHDRVVVECQHCLGTTECQHAIHFDTGRGITYANVEHWLMCPRCGVGYHAWKIAAPTRPSMYRGCIGQYVPYAKNEVSS